MADDEPGWGLVRPHLSGPAEALGLLQRGLDVGNGDLEHRMGAVVRASADAARNPDAVAGRVWLHEPAVRSRVDLSTPL